MSGKILNKCIVCGSSLSEPLFTLANMPRGAQDLLTEEETLTDAGVTIPLKRCPVCGLAQLDTEPIEYYRDVIRVVGLSDTMRDLRRADYGRLIDGYGLAGKKWIEVGCGNGDFLKVLSEFPVEIYGTEHDPANVAAAGKSLGSRGSVFEYFPGESSDVLPGAPYDVFLSFNFLEHQPDPLVMLRCIYNSLEDGGTGLITVPSFEYILNNGRYYELIRDHIGNYDMSALMYLMRLAGFKILERDFIGIGDTLRIIVQKPFRGEIPDKLAVRADEGNNELPAELSADYRRFAESYYTLTGEINSYAAGLKSSGRTIAMWGAGHQGLTVAATTDLKDIVRYIIDSSEKKQGLYAPASHIPIVSPDKYMDDPVDVIMIAAPGYVPEIARTIREKYSPERLPVTSPKIIDLIDLRER